MNQNEKTLLESRTVIFNVVLLALAYANRKAVVIDPQLAEPLTIAIMGVGGILMRYITKSPIKGLF